MHLQTVSAAGDVNSAAAGSPMGKSCIRLSYEQLALHQVLVLHLLLAGGDVLSWFSSERYAYGF